MKTILTLFCFVLAFSLYAQQETLPYSTIPAASEKFTAGTMAAHVIDGLGFRYYWATDGLREIDLAFKPSVDARTSQETLEHIYEMSTLILHVAQRKPYEAGLDVKLPFSELRKRTLDNLKNTSDLLRKASDSDFNTLKVMFKTKEKTYEYPFWHIINGPVEDCIWHVGQVVSFRRSSGLPLSEKVDFFMGVRHK